MLDVEEIKAAIREASKGKTKRRAVRRALDNLDEAAEEIRRILPDWQPIPHERGTVQEGKYRKRRDNIQKPCWWPEQIIHHLIVRQLKPILIPRMHRYVCGILGRRDAVGTPGRGALFAAKTVTRWRNQYGNKRFYVLQADIRHFYDEIDIPVLKTMLARRIRDRRFLALCDKVLDTAGPGIPKGFYTSPWFAQVYLEGLDSYILQSLRPDHYLRYMDNIIILHHNKRQLRKIRDAIQRYLTAIGLSLNRHTQVYRFEGPAGRGRAVDCMGYMIHRNRVAVRKGILKRIRARARRISRRGRCTVHDARAMVSYAGWLRHADTWQYYRRYIRPYADLRRCRRIIARRDNHDRLAQCNRQSGDAA